MATHAINWFDLPVSDIDRALKFYSTILAANMTKNEAMSGYTMAMFPAEDGVSGAIVQGEGYNPSQKEGSVVYLNGGDDLSVVLDRVEAAGGKIAMPKSSIGENGFIAYIIDTEGNKVGLHSMN